jgi:peroxiredoxin
LGISVDSAESHRKFIAKHGLKDLTLLSDPGGTVARMYGAYHWLFPVASRTYILIDGNRRIVFERKMAVFPLENQTETLLREIDAHVVPK